MILPFTCSIFTASLHNFLRTVTYMFTLVSESLQALPSIRATTEVSLVFPLAIYSLLISYLVFCYSHSTLTRHLSYHTHSFNTLVWLCYAAPPIF